MAVAGHPEPTGPYLELAREARRMIGGLTPRAVALKTGGRVSHDTVRRVLNGEKIGADRLDLLSETFSWDANRLRRAGGYPPLVDWSVAEASDAPEETPPPVAPPSLPPSAEGELEEALQYIRDPDTQEVLRFYLGLPEDLRLVAKETLRGMKNAGEIVRRRQEARTIGKRSDREENPARRPDAGDPASG